MLAHPTGVEMTPHSYINGSTTSINRARSVRATLFVQLAILNEKWLPDIHLIFMVYLFLFRLVQIKMAMDT